VRAYTNRDDPLFGLPNSFIAPADFTLGPLYNEISADARSREVYALLADFFRALSAGRDGEALFHPDYRSFLVRNLRGTMYPDGEELLEEEIEEEAEEEEEKVKKEPPVSVLKSAIRNFRTGKFLFSGEGDMAQTQILLFGAKGTAQGEILAEKKGERWYISGITVDFADLFLPRKDSGGEVFDPGPSAGSVF
jgi:hypothetical protein